MDMDLPLIAEELGRLENPSLVGDLLYSAATGSFWNWGVLLLTAVVTALAATAVGILLSKLQLSRFRRRKTLIRLPSFYSSGSDDDDASVSSSDGEDDEEEEMDEMEDREEGEEESEDFGRGKMNEMGSFSFSSFSLADFVGGVGVVKAWDGFGLGFDRTGGGVSFLDISRGDILRSYNGGASGDTTVVQFASPAEIVSAADDAGGSVVKVWDVRAGNEAPAAAALPLLRRRVTGVSAREGKLFVGDEGGEVAALDLRNLSQLESCESFGSWWRSAARCLSLLSPRLENA
ncbi:hypothetical protein IEQ34_020379 [Dendrobium chrysotoxum]|uniref:Uncharacterized protein n=1 Tax=Dendrobium chrysotoxum TaxID=161865 RepID=A0AAV7G2M2_DENCH|nr:hypothetical protein IEQ34_020379 [Dendrobium chrysotoxum]